MTIREILVETQSLMANRLTGSHYDELTVDKAVAALEALQREAVIAELEAMADSLRSFGVRDLILARIAALKAEGEAEV